jgi:hypothetical protein
MFISNRQYYKRFKPSFYDKNSNNYTSGDTYKNNDTVESIDHDDKCINYNSDVINENCSEINKSNYTIDNNYNFCINSNFINIDDKITFQEDEVHVPMNEYNNFDELDIDHDHNNRNGN